MITVHKESYINCMFGLHIKLSINTGCCSILAGFLSHLSFQMLVNKMTGQFHRIDKTSCSTFPTIHVKHITDSVSVVVVP